MQYEPRLAEIFHPRLTVLENNTGKTRLRVNPS